MAYNNYFPQTYQPYYQQQFQQQFQPQQQNNGITWVQGEAGAKAAFVAAGQSALLMDSDATCFYIKTVDASGMPLPLRIFDYTERSVPHTGVLPPTEEKPRESREIDLSGYVTKAELDERLAAIMPKGEADE